VNRCFHLGDDDGPLFNALSWAGDDDSPIANYLRSKGARTPEELGVTAQAAVSDPVVDHFAGRFGPVRPQSLGEIVPDDVPIALHVVSPTVARPHVVLFTKGMSTHPMTVPVGEEDYRFAELFIELPGDWPMGDRMFRDPDSSWPVEWLRRLAKYPHYTQTWLGGPVAIVSNGDPPEPLSPGTPFTALLLLADGDFRRPDGSIVQTYRLFPLFSEERDLERALGADELLRRFDRAGIGFVVDSNRQNVATLTS
jgi:hypothetical protein